VTKHKDLKAQLLKDPEARKEYDALEEEFALMLEVAKARLDALRKRLDIGSRSVSSR
jgi:hypothetical protein